MTRMAYLSSKRCLSCPTWALAWQAQEAIDHTAVMAKHGVRPRDLREQ